MSFVLSTTLPIFLVIGLGFFSTVARYTSAEHIRGIGVFVVRFALPAMMFRALSERSIRDIFDWHYLAVYAVGSLVAFAIGFFGLRRLRRAGVAECAMGGLGASTSNSGFIGSTIATLAVGPDALVALSLTMLIENLLMIPLALGLAESEARTGEPFYRIAFFVLRRLTRNPMVLGIVAGTLVSFVGWHPPVPLTRAIGLVADASSAAALFSIGGVLAGLVRGGEEALAAGSRSAVALVVAAKLVVHPGAVALAALCAPAIPAHLHTSMVLFAASPMLSVFAILSHPYGVEKIAAAALFGATCLSFFTMSAVLALV